MKGEAKKYKLWEVQYLRNKKTGQIQHGIPDNGEWYKEVILDIPQIRRETCYASRCFRFCENYEAEEVVAFTSYSRRKDYYAGESILVATKCEHVWHTVQTSFKVYTVSEVIKGVGCRICEWLPGMIPFNCIYPFSRYWPTYHQRCRHAIITWILCVKNILCRDVRKMIAPLMWETRDDREWEDDPKFKEAARKRLKVAAKRWRAK